jgi:glycerol-3-phosphate acyltransferase PlsX
MRIAVDAMGGDYAPDEIIAGAVEAAELIDTDDSIILVGPEELIKSKLPATDVVRNKITVVDAPEVIGMDEPPVESLRKKLKNSISVMAKLAKHGQADAVISAGNTGACIAAFQMRMRNLEGVQRPGIAVVFPTFGGPVVICDVGANIACKPINLYQYGVMSSLYAKHVLGIDNPKVGLIAIGEEDAKGNENIKKAREFFKSDPKINFIGNVEGRDIFKGTCNVVVCEGFTGNVILKLSEGLSEGIFKAIKQELAEAKISFLLKAVLALSFKKIMKNIYKKYDYHEYGGAPLLGVAGTAIISHGSSKAKTIKNAILNCKTYHSQHINHLIEEYLSQSTVRLEDEQANSVK